MSIVLTNDYLIWLGERTRFRYLQGPRGVDMGRHSHPEETNMLVHRGYQCETCKGFWAALEPEGADQPEELPCLATEGCEGPVVALYPVDEPPPDWVPVIIQGGKK